MGEIVVQEVVILGPVLGFYFFILGPVLGSYSCSRSHSCSGVLILLWRLILALRSICMESRALIIMSLFNADSTS
jgi:hypothetical protein